MSKIDDGGPAFPLQVEAPVDIGSLTTTVHGSRTVATISYGLSLRDWFAGQALVGIIASPAEIIGHPSTPRDVTAALAYEYADAMIDARKDGQRGGS